MGKSICFIADVFGMRKSGKILVATLMMMMMMVTTTTTATILMIQDAWANLPTDQLAHIN